MGLRAGLTSPQRMLKPVEKQRVAEEIAEQLRSLILERPVPARLEAAARARAVEAAARQPRVAARGAQEARAPRARADPPGRRHARPELHGDRRHRAGAAPVAARRRQARADPRPARVPPDLRPRDRAARRGALDARTTTASRKLRALADTRRHRSPAPLELFDLDFDFYVAVAQLSGNQVMLLLINTVRDGVRGFMPLLANLAGARRDRAQAPPRADRRDREGRRRRAPAGSPTTTCAWAPSSPAGMGGKPELQPQPLPD